MLLTAILAATLQLASSGQVQLLPAGEFKARDGRPGKGLTWKLDDAQGAALAARVNADIALNQLVIDYEHQTLLAPANGQRAPAAGWVKSVEWRSGEGLFGQVEWTAAARAHIDAGEYRYLSPVIKYDPKSGVVTGIDLAALTNYPALQGMDPAVAALTRRNDIATDPPPENHMALLAALIAALGMPAETTEAAALSAVSTLQAKKAPPLSDAIATALGLKPGADEAAALSAVNALKASESTTTQLIATLTADVAALRTQLNNGELTQLVDGAIEAGKFSPAHRDWLLGLGRKDLAALRTQIAASPVIPGLKGQKPAGDGGGGGAATAALTATQKLIADQLGLTHEAYAKQMTAETAKG